MDTGITKTSSKNGYPSHLIPLSKKGKEWCLDYIKAFHSDTENTNGKLFRKNIDNYKDWREYASGDQNIDQYKELLGAKTKRNKGKKESSWKNLDWSILPIGPKFVEILFGKIKNEPRILKVKGIDKQSLNKEKQYESELAEYVYNKKWMAEMQDKMGFKFETPIEEGNPEIENMGEIELYKEMFYKDRYALETYDFIKTIHNDSDWTEQLRDEVIEDLIKVGAAGTKVYIDSGDGMVKIRRCIPEEVKTNNVRFHDFRDMYQAGEYINLTISELKQMAGNQFTEEEYEKIADKSTANTYSSASFTSGNLDSSRYDNQHVTLFDAQWFSNDERTQKVRRNKYGNKMAEMVDSDFLPKNVTDDDYAKKNEGLKYITRKKIKNVFKGKWIVDTEYIFDYGLETNMLRQSTVLHEALLGYTFYTTNFDSIVRRIIPILNSIQLDWIQHQNHIARSRPSGLSIEMSAFQDLSLGKGGNEKLSPKEALRLYMDTGILIWRRKDWNGHMSQWTPVQEMQNGISEASMQHFNNILAKIDLLRGILGLNEVSDASTPNPDIGKYVTQVANQGTNNAIAFLYKADKSIYRRTSHKIALEIPNIINNGVNPGLVEALGERTFNFFKANKNMVFFDASITIDVGPTEEKRERISSYISISLERQEITIEDAAQIDDEENPHRQLQLLKKAKIDKANRASLEAERSAKLEQEKNIASAKASSEMEIEKEKALSVIRMEEEELKSKIALREKRADLKNQLILLEAENKYKRNLEGEKIDADILMNTDDNETLLETAHISARQAKQQSSVSKTP